MALLCGLSASWWTSSLISFFEKPADPRSKTPAAWRRRDAQAGRQMELGFDVVSYFHANRFTPTVRNFNTEYATGSRYKKAE